MKAILRLSTWVLALALGLALSSCKQSTSSDVPSGSITGTVSLWGANGPLVSSQGVTVSLDNTHLTTLTDSTGYWRIDNVPAGNYDITVTKPGFGLCRAFGVPISGPGLSYLKQITLGAAPTMTPVLSNVVVGRPDTSESSVAVFGGLGGGCDKNSLIFFADVTPNVQPGDAHAMWDLVRGGPYDDSAGRFKIDLQDFYIAGLKHGATIYLTASQVNSYSVYIPGGGISSGTYYDPEDNSTRFITPGPRSNVVAVTLP